MKVSWSNLVCLYFGIIKNLYTYIHILLLFDDDNHYQVNSFDIIKTWMIHSTIIHFHFLSWAILHFSYTLTTIALLCLSCEIWRNFISFWFTLLWRIFFYIIEPSLELSKPHACVACIALLGSLAVVPTLGFCFCFFVVVVYSFFKKTIILWLRVGSKG